MGEARLFKATAFDVNHKKISGASIIFTLSDNTIGIIDPSGLFIAAKAGVADVIVTSGSITAKARVRVLSNSIISDDDDEEDIFEDEHESEYGDHSYIYDSRDDDD